MRDYVRRESAGASRAQQTQGLGGLKDAGSQSVINGGRGGEDAIPLRLDGGEEILETHLTGGVLEEVEAVTVRGDGLCGDGLVEERHGRRKIIERVLNQVSDRVVASDLAEDFKATHVGAWGRTCH